jgi:hypothetical protein
MSLGWGNCKEGVAVVQKRDEENGSEYGKVMSDVAD